MRRTVAEARSEVWKLFLLGFLIAVVCYGLAAAAFPHTSYEPGIYRGEPIGTDHGDAGTFWGLVGLAAIGELCMFIAVIAWGVRYGIEAAAPNAEAPSPKGPTSPDGAPRHRQPWDPGGVGRYAPPVARPTHPEGGADAPVVSG